MTNHFNGLSEAEAERLALLVEECAEVIQAASKINRHGYQSTNPDEVVDDDHYPTPNRTALEKEIGDVLCAIELMIVAGDISRATIAVSRRDKEQKISRYLHHQ